MAGQGKWRCLAMPAMIVRYAIRMQRVLIVVRVKDEVRRREASKRLKEKRGTKY